MIALLIAGALLWAFVLLAIMRRLLERRAAHRTWRARRAEHERRWCAEEAERARQWNEAQYERRMAQLERLQ